MKSKLVTVVLIAAISAPFISTNILATGVSANIALTNEYRFRGISQSDEAFAIQGGFDYENENGFHAGIWSSSVDFQVQTVEDASTELDVYAGYGGEIGSSGIAWDIGFLHYNYPNADSSLNYNFTEINGSLSYQWLTLFVAHTSDYFAGSGAADYINLAAEFGLANEWSAGASLGHQSVDDNAAWGTPDWSEYKLFVGKSYGGFDYELAYIDTDLSSSECFGGSDWCDGTVTIAVSKSF